MLILGALVYFRGVAANTLFRHCGSADYGQPAALASLETEPSSGLLFLFVSLPFLILFVSGVAVDLLESRMRSSRTRWWWERLSRTRLSMSTTLLELRHVAVR